MDEGAILFSAVMALTALFMFVLATMIAVDRKCWYRKAMSRLDQLIEQEQQHDDEREAVTAAVAQMLERLTMCEDCPLVADICDDRVIAIAEGRWQSFAATGATDNDRAGV